MTNAQDQVKIGELVARAWRDKAFKDQLVSTPKQVLADAGVQVPGDTDVEVLEEGEAQTYLVLPDGKLPYDKRVDSLPPDSSTQQVLLHLLTRAEDDPAFRGLLLGDGDAALAQVGAALPGGTSLKAVENSAGRRYLVLPREPGEEFSDEDLDAVSGGAGVAVASVTVAVFVST